MSQIKYQNPNDANVTSTLDSVVSYPNVDTSVAAGPVEVRREIIIVGDQAGTNAVSELIDIQMQILAELRAIRYGMGRLIGEYLTPDLNKENSPTTGAIA